MAWHSSCQLLGMRHEHERHGRVPDADGGLLLPMLSAVGDTVLMHAEVWLTVHFCCCCVLPVQTGG